MRYLTVGLFLFGLLSGVVSCGGGTFFISSNDHGVSFFTVSGTVSIVQVIIINGGQVTVVTLLNPGAAQTFNFCGNVAGQFPFGTSVTITFTQNGRCNTVLQVN
jgi:hypothetical protein